MIRFRIDHSQAESSLDMCATFPHRQAIFLKKKAAPVVLREVLRIEFVGHLNTLLEKLLELVEPNAVWAPAIKVRSELKKTIELGCKIDHVSYARMVDNLLPKLHMLHAITQHTGMMTQLLDDITRTVEHMTLSPESLWVRGRIELLSGEIIEPWKNTESA